MEEDARWQGWLTAAQNGDRLAYAMLLAAVLPWLAPVPMHAGGKPTPRD